jgi:glutaredoxin
MDVVLYTRRGCHLCETVEDLLPHHAPQARVVDVSGDSLLEMEFGLRIPVLVVDGRAVAEGKIDEAMVIVALANCGFTDRD